MTELQLYKFITDNNIEWHWYKNESVDDVAIFLYFSQVEAFHKILSPCLFDDEGISCTMKDGYFCFWMGYICEYYGVEIENVFLKG